MNFFNDMDPKDPKQRDEYWNSFSDHGFSNPEDPNYSGVLEQFRSNGMTKAAMFCGIGSIIGILFGLSLPFGALGIVLALLSKEHILSKQAKAAIRLSAIGMTAFSVMLAVSIYTLVSTGVWGLMMDGIRNLDPNDPYAVSELQTQMIDELMRRMNGDYSGAPEHTGTSSGQTASAADDRTTVSSDSASANDSAADDHSAVSSDSESANDSAAPDHDQAPDLLAGLEKIMTGDNGSPL